MNHFVKWVIEIDCGVEKNYVDKIFIYVRNIFFTTQVFSQFHFKQELPYYKLYYTTKSTYVVLKMSFEKIVKSLCNDILSIFLR